MAITIRHFDQELDDLKQKLLSMGAAVEESDSRHAPCAGGTRHSSRNSIIENYLRINSLDVQVDEDSIRLLALHNHGTKIYVSLRPP